MTLGKRLAAYRKQNRLTQQQLGEQLNVSAQAVSKWENDQAQPDLVTICKLAALYQISVDTLLTGEDRPAAVPVPTDPVQNTAQDIIQPDVDSQGNQSKQEEPTTQADRNEKAPIVKRGLSKGAKSICAFFKKYRAPSAILLCTAVIVIALTLFVQLYVFDIFNINTVEQVYLGMTADQVTDLLGTPDSTAGTATGGTVWIYHNWKYHIADLPDQKDNTNEVTKKLQKLEDRTYSQAKIMRTRL
ncbi:MAG: helix-turn-helix domain-containing protein [Clostridia bacterium]|nr:helix-turn-helix domain-containing protein [Clostridia bacterium]